MILSTATPSRAMFASFRATLAKVELFFGGTNDKAERESGVPAKMSRAELWSHVHRESARQKVPANLIWGLIAASSNFNQDARSPRGAVGFMQIMPGTADDFNLANIEAPRQNISGGILYFRSLMQQYDGEVPLAIAAYRFGPGAVRKSQPLPEGIQRFVASVLEYSKSGHTLKALPNRHQKKSSL